MKRRFYALAALAALLVLSFQSPASFAGNAPLQGAHQDLVSDMETLEPEMLPRMNLLWRAAVQRNSTLQLALQKINEKTDPKTKEKNKTKWTQGLLSNLIQIGGMGGSFLVGNASPMVASAALSSIAAPDAPAETRLTAVTSADLVVLAREIEDAQAKLVLNYIRYRQARDEALQRQAAVDHLTQRAAVLAQASPAAADMINTVVADQILKRQQALASMQTCRNLLVLAAGDAAVDTLDKQDAGLIPVEESPSEPQEKP